MPPTSLELSTLGHRIRHQRVSRGFTLDELGERVGVAGSQLSLIENGKREPKLSLLQAIADATGADVADLLSTEPPNRRAALEIELERAQNSSVFRQLGIAPVKVTKGMSDETIETVLGPAPRAAAPRAGGDRDPRGGPPRQHRPAGADARARQLPAGDREAGREAAQARRSRLGRAHPPHGQHHGRAARLRADLRQRPAALGPLGHRPRARPHLPAARLDPGRARPALDGPAGHGPPAARPPPADRLRRLPAAAARDQLLRRVRPHARDGIGRVPAAGEEGPQPRRRRLPRRVRGDP